MKKILSSLCIVATLTAFSQVGISKVNGFVPNTNVDGDILTSDTYPVMLDIDGKTRVRTMEEASPNSYSPVVRDNTTGVLKILSDLNSGNKPINITTYVIENINEDWVSNFNTLIPTENWTVAIIGSRFYNAKGGQGFIITNRYSVYRDLVQNYPDNVPHWNQYQSKYDVMAAPNIYAFQQSGTWRLSADFIGSGTNGKLGDESTTAPLFENGKWEIDVLIIDNSIVNVLPGSAEPANLGGSSTGTADGNVLD